MGKWKWFVAATIFAGAVAQPVNARDIKAMCYTSFDGKPFITNIAPIAIPDSLKSSYEIKEKLKYLASSTMIGLGLQTGQNVGCTYEDPVVHSTENYWQNGNQPEADMINYQRGSIKQGYQLFRVERLDSGYDTPKGGLGGATAPPDIHDDGQPLSFYYSVGMVPTAQDRRNPNCVSNVVTLKEKVDWKEWGSEGRAAGFAAPYKAAFDARCRQLGALGPGPGGNPIFDRKDGRFVRQPGSNDRIVTLP